MKDKCRAAVLGAARAKNPTRDLKDQDFKRLEDMILSSRRHLAVTDPKWGSYSNDQRLLLAAQAAKDEVLRLAARHVENAQRQALKMAETEARVLEQQKRLSMSRAEAWADDIQRADDEVTAVTKEYASKLMGALKAAESMQGAGLVRRVGMLTLRLDNPAMTRDIAIEMHAKGNGGTGNKLAKSAADLFLKVQDEMRARFNAAGGDVGKLDYGYMPHIWEPDRIMRAGSDRYAQDMLPLVDRSRFVGDDGRPLGDAEVLQILRSAGDTLGSNGANQIEPGSTVRGRGALANRGSEHRVIHFKDGDAYIAAMRMYGSGGMYDAIMGHIQMMARDIAMLERYGPNPYSTHQTQKAMAQGQKDNAPLVAWSDLDHHWAALAGTGAAKWEYTLPALGRFTGAGSARFWQHARNIEVFSKLGGAVISSVTDIGTIMHSVNFNKLSYFDAIANSTRSLTPFARRGLVEFMNTQGLIADTFINTMNRMTGEQVAATWSANISNQTMKASLMNYWTDGLRRAFSLTMQQGVAKWLSKDWGALDEWTRDVLLASRGITEADWILMQGATKLKTQWGDILTPQAIYASGNPRAAETAKRYLALLNHESTMAVVEPDIAARAFLRRGTAPGSLQGEGLRLISQFQAFPAAMFTRHWRRILDTPRGLEGAPLGFQGEGTFNRLTGIAALLVTMTALGAIAYQAKQMISGKDPVNMNPTDEIGRKFWMQAFMQGGGLGFLGGIMLNAPDERFSRGWEGTVGVLGPVAGSVGSFMDLTQGNLMESAQGKDTHFGAEALRFAKSHAPVMNLWYLRAAIDHAVLHDAQEYLSPGYLSRVRNKQRKDWGGRYWWEPGASFDEMRAPDWQAVAGD